MDMEKILQELDRLFATYQMDRVEGYLESRMEEARTGGDRESLVTLMNEMIGYLRDASKYEKACAYCRRVLDLLEDMGLKGSVPYATTLLNVANAYRAAGKLEESMIQYRTVLVIYQSHLTDTDFRYASLYNNMSLLYQEMQDYEMACKCLEKALLVVNLYEEARIEAAVTYTNLAASQLKLGMWQEAMINLKKAFSIFEMDEKKDYHYSGALSAMGEAQYMAGNLEESAFYYDKALQEIEKNVGRTKAYEITLQNLKMVKSQVGNIPSVRKRFEKGMELCQAFYKEYGEPMLWEKFPEYMPYLATGLVGEGSECFGFDDEISRDHDFGPGFCIWLTDQTYDVVGERMQEAYDALPVTYMGITRQMTSKASRRVGVFRIGEFYENLLGISDIPESQNQWLFLEDYRLATATNGKVFFDGMGEFSRIRKGLLSHYPEEVRVKKIAREAALMAQSGQYNYGRMYGRGDKVTAQIALSEFMKHTMSMVYLLNRKYAPFYKWMHKGMDKLPVLAGIMDILNALADMHVGDERIPQTIEIIVALIIDEMKKQSLTCGEDNYLDHHTDNILKSIGQNDTVQEGIKLELVKRLVRIEWKAFDKVQNEGGRAACQDDWNTFSIMRKSQYMTWTVPMLQSYIQDFEMAKNQGRNLIAEKYGRMMESTDPIGYIKIKRSLPQVPGEKRAIIEEIVKIQIKFMEAFAEEYPKAASQARAIHSSEDTLWNTSYETYLRGELMTYSDKTLDLYGRFIAGLCREGKNPTKLIMENTARLYGYASLEDLEQKLK